MSEQSKFLLRKVTGDQLVESEQDVRDWLQKGQCKPADLLFDFAAGKWGRVGDHAAVAEFFSTKPAQNPERKLIYFMGPGSSGIPQGPYSTKEIQGRVQSRELCDATWIFVDGDKEWRQVKNVKILHEMLPAFPTDIPAKPAAPEPPKSGDLELGFPEQGDGDRASLTRALEGLELSGATAGSTEPAPSFSASMAEPEREDPTMSISMLGLGLSAANPEPAAVAKAAPVLEAAPAMELAPALEMAPALELSVDEPAAAPPAPPPAAFAPPKAAPAAPSPSRATAPSVPPKAPPSLPNAGAPPKAPPPAAPSPPPKAAAPAAPSVPPSSPPPVAPSQMEKDTGSFDGITAQIPMDPIWLVKRGNLETVAGPFRFLEVVKLLEEGKLNKNDKISREGTNRFVKIQQQYEFNVKFVVETVVENGVEVQRIVIKRRHPRVPYLTDVQITGKAGVQVAACVNISAGGILVEMPKGDFTLGDILDIKLLPTKMIDKTVACKAMVIGKIPKMPPGFALKFENLKSEDKEAIEFFVAEALKREMQKNS